MGLMQKINVLTQRGVLGMNRRNIAYIGRYNPRKLFPLVDDKLKTKRMAIASGVKVPKLIGVIDSQYDVRNLGTMVSQYPGFCIKPSKGAGGKGILVIVDQREGQFIRVNGQAQSLADVQRHVSNILAGLFSLSGVTDVALIEEIIQPCDHLSRYSFEGVPDVRVILFKGFPVMAMMRLSTSASNGKANLHQGAIGVGIHIKTGRAVRAVQFDRPIETHPDTGEDLSQLTVSHWPELLNLACACYENSGLGYLGVDLVLDREQGPMLLELNARPGLSIQLANGAGLLPRLKLIEKAANATRDGNGSERRMSREERIAFAQNHFA